LEYLMKCFNWMKGKNPPTLVDSTTIDKSMASLAKSSKRFKDSEVVKMMGWGDNFEVFADRFTEAVGKDPNIHMITPGDVSVFNDYMKVYEKNIHKGFGNSAFVNFKLLEEKLQFLPEGRETAKRIKEVVAFQRRHNQVNEASLEVIRGGVKKIAKEFGVDTTELLKLEAALQSAPDQATANLVEKQIVEFLGTLKGVKGRTAAGDLYLGLRDVMEGMPIDQLKRADGTYWSADMKANAQEVRNAWSEIRKDLLKVTINGLRMEMEVAKKIDAQEGGKRGLHAYLEKLKNMVIDLEVNEKKKDVTGREYDLNGQDVRDLGLTEELSYSLEHKLGYMPHHLLRIHEHLGEVNDYMYQNTIDTPEMRFAEIMNFWEHNGTPDRAKKRGALNEEYYSRNPFFFIARYIHDVSNYNHKRATENILVDSMGSLMKSKDFAKGTVDQPEVDRIIGQGIQLLEGVAEKSFLGGTRGGGRTFGMAMTRLATAMGFNRAMAFSGRTALRNRAGGQFLAWMENGYYTSKASEAWISKNAHLESEVKRELEKYGLLWHRDSHELKEMIGAYNRSPMSAAGTRGSVEEGMLPAGLVEVKDNAGKVIGVTLTADNAGQKFIRFVEKTAVAGSALHQMAENVLRPQVFRSTFGIAHRNLKQMPEWYQVEQMGRNINSESWKKLTPKQQADAIDKWAIGMAGRIANDSVNSSQFDYSEVNKAHALTTKTGKVVGQFKHYMFELMNWRQKAARQGYRAIKAGIKTGDTSQFTNQAAQKFYRMGIGAGLSTFLTTITGLGINNILQSDDLEFIKNNITLLTADATTKEGQAAIEAATYGMGAMTNLGITFSTLMEFARLMQWVNIDEENKWMMASFSEGNPTTVKGADRNYQLMRLLNIQMARLYGQTWPSYVNNNTQQAILVETGLYTSYEERKAHDKFTSLLAKLTGVKKKKKKRKKKADNSAALRALSYIHK